MEVTLSTFPVPNVISYGAGVRARISGGRLSLLEISARDRRPRDTPDLQQTYLAVDACSIQLLLSVAISFIIIASS